MKVKISPNQLSFDFNPPCSLDFTITHGVDKFGHPLRRYFTSLDSAKSYCDKNNISYDLIKTY